MRSTISCKKPNESTNDPENEDSSKGAAHLSLEKNAALEEEWKPERTPAEDVSSEERLLQHK